MSCSVSVFCIFELEFDICFLYLGGLDISLLFIKKHDLGLRLLIHIFKTYQPNIFIKCLQNHSFSMHQNLFLKKMFPSYTIKMSL